MSDFENHNAIHHKSFAILKLYVNSTIPGLVESYEKHIENHNHHIMTDPFPNSGFDVLIPRFVKFSNGISTEMVNLNIKAEMIYNNETASPFYMYPRSSMSRTPLMLANHTGIIDSGYRGFLISALRSLDPGTPYQLDKNTRLLQICHPSLCPIIVEMVKESDLSVTARGEGGFGSTGIIG